MSFRRRALLPACVLCARATAGLSQAPTRNPMDSIRQLASYRPSHDTVRIPRVAIGWRQFRDARRPSAALYARDAAWSKAHPAAQ